MVTTTLHSYVKGLANSTKYKNGLNCIEFDKEEVNDFSVVIESMFAELDKENPNYKRISSFLDCEANGKSIDSAFESILHKIRRHAVEEYEALAALRSFTFQKVASKAEKKELTGYQFADDYEKKNEIVNSFLAHSKAKPQMPKSFAEAESASCAFDMANILAARLYGYNDSASSESSSSN